MKQQSNQPSTAKDQALLEFSVGPLRFCAPVLDVVAIISPPEMVHVPVNEDVLVSCFSHNNETVTVLSMHNKFGLPLTRSEKETHIILAYVDGGLKGFWVDQAIDLVQLNDFGSSADDFPGDGKAYSNFLTRDEEIILQTSFHRLFHCAKSSLAWLPGMDSSDTARVEEAVPTGSVEAETTAESDSSDQDLKAEIEHTGPLTASAAIEDRPAGNGPAVKRPVSTGDETRTSPRSPGAPKATRAGAITSNRSPVRPIASVPEPTGRPRPVPVHAAINSSMSEHEAKARPADKGHGFVILALAMLCLLAVAVGSLFWLDAGSGSAISYSEKPPARQDSKTEEVQPATTPDPEKLIAQAPPVIEPSENQSLNEVAEEDPANPQPAGGARLFELRINEQQDTNLYAISSFEPVTQQQEVEPVASEQIFTHVVVKGDTLWHITRRYLDNPNRYPELAAASHINNPHRIYPGDVIRIIVSR